MALDNVTQLIAEALTSRKLLSNEQFQALINESSLQRVNIFDLLVQKRILTEDAMLNLKGQVLNIPVIDLTGQQVAKEILNIIPEEVARTYHLVPFAKKENDINIALLDPQDYKAVEALDFISRNKGMRFIYYLTSASSLNSVLKQYASLSQEISEALQKSDVLEEGNQDLLKEEESEKVVKSAPVSKTVAVILRHAIEGGASDIHVEPLEMETRVRYRVDGVLHTSLLLPINIHPSLVARIKVLSNLKIDETRLPQDGRFKIKFEGRDVEFRVSTLPLYNREKVVMRILDTSKEALTLEALGFSDRNLEVVKSNIKTPHGLVLVTGPTGSGKSTTLYSLLTILNKEDVNIVTLEDPVEYNIPGVGQAQVRPEVGLTFAAGLRSILRQDPDVVMVGEIRDKETAELAVHAALTGHMVLSTLHTNDAFGAIPRMIDMGIEPFLISSSMNVVVAQRLIRKICDKCQEVVNLPKAEEDTIFAELKDIQASVLPKDLDLTRPLKFKKAKGCPICEQSGYRGRIAMVEVLEVTDHLKEIIAAGKISDINVVKEECKRQGLLTMKQDGIIKALRGLTTLEEVLNATKD
ncbi:MAG: GspE/PulE family protein [Patescibacteria group bacterium]|jgi:type IV pilus assembly protein PilB